MHVILLLSLLTLSSSSTLSLLVRSSKLSRGYTTQNERESIATILKVVEPLGPSLQMKEKLFSYVKVVYQIFACRREFAKSLKAARRFVQWKAISARYRERMVAVLTNFLDIIDPKSAAFFTEKSKQFQPEWAAGIRKMSNLPGSLTVKWDKLFCEIMKFHQTLVGIVETCIDHLVSEVTETSEDGFPVALHRICDLALRSSPIHTRISLKRTQELEEASIARVRSPSSIEANERVIEAMQKHHMTCAVSEAEVVLQDWAFRLGKRLIKRILQRLEDFGKMPPNSLSQTAKKWKTSHESRQHAISQCQAAQVRLHDIRGVMDWCSPEPKMSMMPELETAFHQWMALRPNHSAFYFAETEDFIRFAHELLRLP